MMMLWIDQLLMNLIFWLLSLKSLFLKELYHHHSIILLVFIHQFGKNYNYTYTHVYSNFHLPTSRSLTVLNRKNNFFVKKNLITPWRSRRFNNNNNNNNINMKHNFFFINRQYEYTTRYGYL